MYFDATENNPQRNSDKQRVSSEKSPSPVSLGLQQSGHEHVKKEHMKNGIEDYLKLSDSLVIRPRSMTPKSQKESNGSPEVKTATADLLVRRYTVVKPDVVPANGTVDSGDKNEYKMDQRFFFILFIFTL